MCAVVRATVRAAGHCCCFGRSMHPVTASGRPAAAVWQGLRALHGTRGRTQYGRALVLCVAPEEERGCRSGRSADEASGGCAVGVGEPEEISGLLHDPGAVEDCQTAGGGRVLGQRCVCARRAGWLEQLRGRLRVGGSVRLGQIPTGARRPRRLAADGAGHARGEAGEARAGLRGRGNGD